MPSPFTKLRLAQDKPVPYMLPLARPAIERLCAFLHDTL